MKLLILSIPRTGSSYLIDALNPYFKKRLSEPFRKTPNAESIIHLAETSKHILVKTHYYQLPKDKQLRDKFLNINWKTVVLLRRDIFKCSTSFALAMHLNEFRDYSYNNSSKFIIDEDHYLKCLTQIVRWKDELAEYASKLSNSQIIYYEDLTFVPSIDASNLTVLKNRTKIKSNQEDVTTKSPGSSVIENIDNLYDIYNRERIK